MVSVKDIQVIILTDTYIILENLNNLIGHMIIGDKYEIKSYNIEKREIKHMKLKLFKTIFVLLPLFGLPSCSSSFKKTNSINYDIMPLLAEEEALDYSKEETKYLTKEIFL